MAPHLLMGNFPSKTYNDPSWPDLHVYLNENLISVEGTEPVQTFEIELELTRTDQSGTIRLASQDPTASPLIDPKFLENPTDMDRLIEATEIMIDLFFNTTAFQAIGIQWSPTFEPEPECSATEFGTREYWKCFILYKSETALHPTSSCRMGPNATLAVVDSKLRVFGTNGLRVIDSSVMPFVPNGNTNFPTFMLAEMGSRFILEGFKA